MADSVVTDPPYDLTSIVKRFGKEGAAAAKSHGPTGVYGRASRGFMGQQWDGTGVAFDPETWVAVYNCMKPGAYLAAFGGTRTFHRMAVAIEDAGFEIRDTLMWLYGTGFPKSHDVAKGIDKALGAERGKVRFAARPATSGTMAGASDSRPWIDASRKVGYHEVADNNPATAAAAEWVGWGTALKPAFEPIILARKPFTGTVAANVAAHGTGGINIDACRIPAPEGRWPANVLHDGSPEVLAAFGDSGSAARFFYCAKAGKADRAGSKHPTVKPQALMRWLVKLVTPPGGLIIEPFAGSGSTVEAGVTEGFDVMAIEMGADYCQDIHNRMKRSTQT